MNAIVINEECHGFIGIAKDVKGAINGLVENNWLHGCDDCNPRYDQKNHEWIYDRVDDFFGKNWQKKLCTLTTQELNELFDCNFYFEEREVWE